MQECFPILFNVMMERRKYINVFLPNKLLQKFTDFALFIITESIKKERPQRCLVALAIEFSVTDIS